MENFSWDDINAAMSRDGAGQTQGEEPQEPQAQPEEQAQPQEQASAPAAPTNFWANLNDALANHEEHRFGVNMDAITDEAIMRRTEERRKRDAQKRLERLSRPVEGLSDEDRYKALQERERRIAAYHQVQREQRGERMPEPEPERGIWDEANETLRMMQEDRRRTESALQAVRGLQEGSQSKGDATDGKSDTMLGYNPDNPQEVKPTGQMIREAEARDEAAMNDELERMRINDPEGYAQVEREVAAEEMKRRRDALPGIVKAPLYAVDLWDSAVGGLAGGAVTIAEGAGNIVGGIGRMFGSDSVGRAGNGVRNWAKGAREAIEEGVPTDLYDTSGGGVVNSLLETGKNIAHVSGEFAPAMIPLVGQAYAGALIGAGATNAAADTYEVARATGLSKGQSARLALLKGELDGLVNMLLMGKFKGVWGRTAKGASDGTFMLKEANKYVNELFRRNGLQKLLDAGKAAGRKAMGELPEVGKVGGLMGASGVANQMIDETATGQFSEPESIVKTGIAGFVEGGLFHLMNKAARNIMSKVAKEIKFNGLAQSLNGEFARKLLRDWQARAMIYGNNQPEAIQAIISARQAGMDVTPEMLRKVGIPRQVAPSVRDCNAIADVFASDYRAWNEWVEEAYPSKERERQVGLAREIRSGLEMDAADAAKERAANEGGMLSADEAREQQHELNDAAERGTPEQMAERKEALAQKQMKISANQKPDEIAAEGLPESAAAESAPTQGEVPESSLLQAQRQRRVEMKKLADNGKKIDNFVDDFFAAVKNHGEVLNNEAFKAENADLLAAVEDAIRRNNPQMVMENLNKLKKKVRNFAKRGGAQQEGTNETGNGADEESAQPKQGAREPQGGETEKPVEGTAPQAEAPREGVVEPSAGAAKEKVSPPVTEKSAEPAETARETPKSETSSTANPQSGAEAPVEGVGAKGGAEATTTTPEPAKPAEAASGASGAKPFVAAPAKANDAQKMAYARIGGMQGVTITSAKMGKDGKVRMKYTRQTADGGDPTEYDCTIGKDGLTSTSVAGGKPTKTTASTPAAPTTQPQSNKPNKESSPNPAPKSNRLRRRDGTDPIAEREAAKGGKTETPAAKTETPPSTPEEKDVPMTPRARRNRVAEVQKILAGRPKDLPLTPEAFMAHASDEAYASGRKKTAGLTLAKLRELHGDKTWHNDLGLAPEEAQKVRDAVDRAYEYAYLGDKRGGKYEAVATALRFLDAKPGDLTAIARARTEIVNALDKAERKDKLGRQLLEKYLGEVMDKVVALPPEQQAKIPGLDKLNLKNIDRRARKNEVSATNSEGKDVEIQASGQESPDGADASEATGQQTPSGYEGRNPGLPKGARGQGGSLGGNRHLIIDGVKGDELTVTMKDAAGKVLVKGRKMTTSEWAALANGADAVDGDPAAPQKGDLIRRSKSDAADIPDSWTPEAKKPLERVAQTLRNVVTVGGKKVKVIFADRPTDVDGQTRKSIGGVFTGTAADYANRSRQGGRDDGPSLQKIGSGEGSQVYGWGLYGSTVRGVAEGYGRADRDRKRGRRTTLKADVLLDGKPIRDNYDALETHGGAIGMLEDYGSVDAVLKNYEFFENHGTLRAGERADYEWLKANRDRIALREVGDVPQHLYEQTFFTDRAPGDESHLLKWYEPSGNIKEQLGWIREQAKREGFLDEPDKYGNTLSQFLNTAEKTLIGRNGQDIYSAIEGRLGSPKAASEFLARAGIDGVKYPVDSYGGKPVKDGDEAGWNYVSFRDDNIRVVHKWVDGNIRYMKNAEGVTVGEYDAAKGEIRLYPGAKVADVVHEFTHPLVDFARAEAKAGRPELLNKIKEIIDAERETWEQPVRDAYKGKGEGEILEEIFTHAMGARGADLFGKSTKTLQGRRWYNRLWEAIKGVWRDFATKMGWNRANLRGIEKMSPEDAAQRILSEMAKGRNFGDAVTGGEGTRKAFAGRKGVSPAEDAAYMDAVNRGDMETAQRMVREAAARAMPNTKVVDDNGDPLRAYHATDNDFTVFDKRRLGEFTDKNAVDDAAKQLARLGFWFNEKDLHKQIWAKKAVDAYLNITNPYKTSLDELWGELREQKAESFVLDLKARGHDGIVLDDSEFGGKSFVAFEPNQIKSADPVTYDDAGNVIPLSQRFNPKSNDIRESRRVVLPQPPTAKDVADWLDGKDDVRRKWRRALQDKNIVTATPPPAVPGGKPIPTGPTIDMAQKETKGEVVQRKMQDFRAPLKRMEEQAGIVDKSQSVYHALDLNYGKNRDQAQRLTKTVVEPMMKRLYDADLTWQKQFDASGGRKIGLDDYVYAVHALERNPFVSSGMDDAKARAILGVYNSLPMRQRTAIYKSAQDLFRLNKATLMRRVQSGRLSMDEANRMLARYQHYVPLRTDMEQWGDDLFNTGTGGWSKHEFHKALGRTTEADSPTVFSLMQANDAITGANKNEARLKLWDIVAAHPELGRIRRMDKLTKKWSYTDGREEWVADERYNERDRDDLVMVKRNGQLYAIQFNGEFGRRIAAAVTGRNLAKFPDEGVFSYVPRVTRLMAEMRTQLVPTFILRNIKADHLDVLLNSMGDFGPTGAAKFLGSVEKNFVSRDTHRAIDQYFNTGRVDTTTEAGGLFDEFTRTGSLIGGGNRMGYADTATELSDFIHDLQRGKSNPARMAKSVKSAISVLNEHVETGTRFSVYATLRKMGWTPEEAATYCRDLTTNFNRKGEWTPVTNSLFMFSNAAIQGLARAYKSGWPGAAKFGGRTLATVATIGALGALWNHFVGSDDERKKSGEGDPAFATEYDKANRLVVGAGGYGANLRVRYPWAAVQYASNKLAEYVLGDCSFKDLAKGVGENVAVAMLQEPFGHGGTVAQTLSPSLLVPFTQVAEGKDFRGEDLYAKKFDENTPDSENGKRSTGEGYKAVARAMNRATGGDEFESGLVDVSPETVKLVVDTLGGGVWTDIARLGTVVEKSIKSAKNHRNEFELRDVPFLGDLVHHHRGPESRYYEAMDEYSQARRKYQKTKDMKVRAALGREKPYVRDAMPGKSYVDILKEHIDELTHQMHDEIKVGRKWVQRETPLSDEKKNELRRRRAKLMATVLRKLGKVKVDEGK